MTNDAHRPRALGLIDDFQPAYGVFAAASGEEPAAVAAAFDRHRQPSALDIF